jgi:hypothetical protein
MCAAIDFKLLREKGRTSLMRCSLRPAIHQDVLTPALNDRDIVRIRRRLRPSFRFGSRNLSIKIDTAMYDTVCNVWSSALNSHHPCGAVTLTKISSPFYQFAAHQGHRCERTHRLIVRLVVATLLAIDILCLSTVRSGAIRGAPLVQRKIMRP